MTCIDCGFKHPDWDCWHLPGALREAERDLERARTRRDQLAYQMERRARERADRVSEDRS